MLSHKGNVFIPAHWFWLFPRSFLIFPLSLKTRGGRHFVSSTLPDNSSTVPRFPYLFVTTYHSLFPQLLRFSFLLRVLLMSLPIFSFCNYNIFQSVKRTFKQTFKTNKICLMEHKLRSNYVCENSRNKHLSSKTFEIYTILEIYFYSYNKELLSRIQQNELITLHTL